VRQATNTSKALFFLKRIQGITGLRAINKDAIIAMRIAASRARQV